MQRKFLLACGALVAFVAFAVMPALASASPVLTENGVAVAVGAKITGTLDPGTSWVITFEGGGEMQCASAHLGGTVTTNSGTVVAANIETARFTSTGTNGACTSVGLLGTQWTWTTSVPWCLETKTAGSATITNGTCGAKNPGGVKLLLKSGMIECEYEKAEVAGSKDMTLSYTLNVSPATTDATGSTFKLIRSNSALCTNFTLDAKFIFETPDATPLTIS